MAHAHFTSEQFLPYATETVFNFFANPENLPRLLPRWQRARIEQASFRPPPPPPPGQHMRSIAAGDGTELTLSFRPVPYSPLRLQWVAAIGHFQWNRQFCDTQLRGPFFFWHHCHKITPQMDVATGRAGTLLRDEVEFQLPLEPVSRLMLPLVRSQFRAMFAFRHKATAELLAAAGR